MAVIVWVHNLAYSLVWGLGRLLARSVGRFLLAVWLLLHEEVRRYFSLAVWGVLIVVGGRATLNYAPPPTKRWLVLSLLLIMAIWAMAVRRAIWFTRHNNLIRVQQRKAFRDLQAEVKGTRQDVNERIARVAWGTPMQSAFRSNRERIAKDAEAAARAEAEAAERAEHEAYLESLPPDHDPFAIQGSR